VVQAVYSDPQVAQVGLTEEAAGAQGQAYETVFVEFDRSLKAQLLGEDRGLLKLLYEPGSDRFLGGAAVGAHAVDLMMPLAVALERRASLHALAEVFGGCPSLGELPLDAARTA
jgi:dihydrolipoamide dehydrogenase